MATWSDVAAAVAALPETEEGTAYGERAWRFRKKLLVWARPLGKKDLAELGDAAPEGDVLGLPTASVEEKEELIAAFPEVFFTTSHFDRYAAVLARLDALPVDVLTQLVQEAWRRHAPERLLKAHFGE